MNLVKWLRKNNTKIMAVVVIVLMVGFVGGSSLTYLLSGSGGADEAIAYYGDDQEITRYDRMLASRELDILTRGLAMDRVLASSQDLMNVLLADLVFAQNRGAGGTIDMVRMMVQQNSYRISEAQLNAMYEDRTVPGDLYWILVTREAESAGIRLATEEVGQWLSGLLAQAPQLYRNATYGQLMQSLINQFNVSEEHILNTLGKLLSVLQYAQLLTSTQSVTTSQVQHIAAQQAESLSVEYVRLPASAFADEVEAPSEETLQEHFERYKATVPGAISETNPYGFGYRLPNRAQLDYIALKLADVAEIIEAPTQEEMERYYQEHREEEFTEEVPADPNDPNSPMVPQTKSYAEVAHTIRSQLRRQRITTRAEQILQEAKTKADADLQPSEPGQELTLEQRREKAGGLDEYQNIAQELSTQYDLPLYSGRTGMLSALDIRNDPNLGRMYITGFGFNPVPLSQVVFSVDPFGDDATVLLTMPEAEMFRTIGPARNPSVARMPDLSNEIMLITRVVGAEPDAAPESLDVQYSTETLDLDEAPEEDPEMFSVREEVVEDVRQLATWDTLGERAEEFRTLAQEQDWQQAVSEFNRLYGSDDPNDPNVFRIDTQPNVQRISQADLQVFTRQVANNPAAGRMVSQAKAEGVLINRLYDLAAAEDETAESQLPQVLEVKANRSYYVVRDISVNRLDQEQFKRMKAMIARQEDIVQSQSLAVVHFNPDNILERMNFRPAEEPEEDQTEQEPAEASS